MLPVGGKAVNKRSVVCKVAIVVTAMAAIAASLAGQNTKGEHSAKKQAESLPSEALIEHTGSTNTSGFNVYLSPDGTARYFISAHRLQAGEKRPELSNDNINASLAKRFFADLKSAMPLSQFPAARCMKSASFGYEMRVRYQGQDSPDLACASSDKRLQALTADAKKIGEALRAAQK